MRKIYYVTEEGLTSNNTKTKTITLYSIHAVVKPVGTIEGYEDDDNITLVKDYIKSNDLKGYHGTPYRL